MPKTQTAELARSLAGDPGVRLVERYVDDGVSGTIPLGERPGGGRLMRDAAAGRFSEIHVYKFDRLGRDAVDLLVVRRRFLELGIRLRSVVEGEPDLLGYDVQAVVADHGRREFLRRSVDGVDRAAREGRYCGGIVPFGYRVEGRKPHARLVPDEAPLCADLSAAGVIAKMFRRIGIDGWSCGRVASELSALGVPPHYVRDARGVRGQRTRGVWRAGRVRNMVVSPVYRGELSFGKRSTKPREPITAAVEPLVPEELWDAAQATLARNRLMPKNTHRTYLLRGVVRCAGDGLTFSGSQGRPGQSWYRCGGKTADRGRYEGGCPSRRLRGETLDAIVWADVERFLRQPGDLLAELDIEGEREAGAAVLEAESVTLHRAIEAREEQRRMAQRMCMNGNMTEPELTVELGRLSAEKADLERRLADLAEPPPSPTETIAARDLLADIGDRLDAGLSDDERAEIVRCLVHIVIHSDESATGGRSARAVITYRFPGVVATRTGTGSSLLQLRGRLALIRLCTLWLVSRQPRSAAAAPDPPITGLAR